MAVWLLHYLTPWGWLTEDQLSKIQTVIFSGVTGAVASAFAQKHMGQWPVLAAAFVRNLKKRNLSHFEPMTGFEQPAGQYRHTQSRQAIMAKRNVGGLSNTAKKLDDDKGKFQSSICCPIE